MECWKYHWKYRKNHWHVELRVEHPDWGAQRRGAGRGALRLDLARSHRDASPAHRLGPVAELQNANVKQARSLLQEHPDPGVVRVPLLCSFLKRVVWKSAYTLIELLSI